MEHILKLWMDKKRSNKYYEYHDRCFEVLKPLVCEQVKNLNDYDKKTIRNAKTLDDVHNIVGHDFTVTAPIQSRAGNDTLQGTRIILGEQPPNAYCFSIQIVTKPERDVQFGKELTHIFNEFEELGDEDISIEQSLELSLSFFYYWVNYGALSRGTAACGLIILNAFLIATGYFLTKPIPGMQIDWEALLAPTHTEFIQKVRGKMEVIPLSKDTGDIEFSKIPKVSKHISTLREMIHILNLKE